MMSTLPPATYNSSDPRGRQVRSCPREGERSEAEAGASRPYHPEGRAKPAGWAQGGSMSPRLTRRHPNFVNVGARSVASGRPILPRGLFPRTGFEKWKRAASVKPEGRGLSLLEHIVHSDPLRVLHAVDAMPRAALLVPINFQRQTLFGAEVFMKCP